MPCTRTQYNPSKNFHVDNLCLACYNRENLNKIIKFKRLSLINSLSCHYTNRYLLVETGMTIGIYRLIFSNTDKCYIGQSINIEHRYKQHLNSFIVGNANSKMQEAYVLFGLPILDILCECSIDNLDKTETEAIEIFDSVNNGFNIYSSASVVPVYKGEEHPRSLHANEEILTVAKLLTCSSNTGLEINKITGVSLDIIQSIASLKSHGWIQNENPEVYQKLIDLHGKRKNPRDASKRGITYPSVVNPNGTIYSNISNLKQFCEEHGLERSNFRRMLRGRNKICVGWKLANG